MTRRTELPELSYDEWHARGTELFGDDVATWRVVCPSCGHVQCMKDYQEQVPHLTEEQILKYLGFSCIGRFTKPEADSLTGEAPCNYAGGGLFGLNPQPVKMPDGEVSYWFAFDEEREPAVSAEQ